MRRIIVGFLAFALLAPAASVVCAAPAANKPAAAGKTAKKRKARRKPVITDADVAKAGNVAPIAAVLSAKPAQFKGVAVSTVTPDSPGINPEPDVRDIPGETSSDNQRALAIRARAMSEKRRLAAEEKVAKSTAPVSVPGKKQSAPKVK